MLLSWNTFQCSSNSSDRNLNGAVLHYFVERAQQLVCLAALGQMIEAVDKIECQRADGHSETERAAQRSLVKWGEQRRPRLNNQVSVGPKEERTLSSHQKSWVQEPILRKEGKGGRLLLVSAVGEIIQPAWRIITVAIMCQTPNSGQRLVNGKTLRKKVFSESNSL